MVTAGGPVHNRGSPGGAGNRQASSKQKLRALGLILLLLGQHAQQALSTEGPSSSWSPGGGGGFASPQAGSRKYGGYPQEADFPHGQPAALKGAPVGSGDGRIEARRPSDPNGTVVEAGTGTGTGPAWGPAVESFRQPEAQVRLLGEYMRGLDDDPPASSRRPLLARRLASIPQDGQLGDSNGYTLHHEAVADVCNPLIDCASLQWVAGVSMKKVRIAALGNTWDGTRGVITTAKLRLVKATTGATATTKADAQGGACLAGNARVVDTAILAPLSTGADSKWLPAAGGTTTTILTAANLPAGAAAASILEATDEVSFAMGGKFKICYSDTGTFGATHADLVAAPSIEIAGVYSQCTTKDCLADKRYNCYAMKESYNIYPARYTKDSNCILDFSKSGEGAYGIQGQGTWSAEFTVQGYDETGLMQGLQTKGCDTTPTQMICKNGGACGAGDRKLVPDTTTPGIPSRSRINLPVVNGKLGTAGGLEYKAFTVRACYCPKLLCANIGANGDYTQKIGIIHFFVVKVCDSTAEDCLTNYNGVAPEYSFRVRVDCPSNACEYKTLNRMKMIQLAAKNDLPSWDSTNGCRSGVDGYWDDDLTDGSGGKHLLPKIKTVGMTHTQNPINCKSTTATANDCALNGGKRQNYKEFPTPPDEFLFVAGETEYERLNFHDTKVWDVCYCDGGTGGTTNCAASAGANWFKVGQVRQTSFRLVSAATSSSDVVTQYCVEFVNQAGTLGFHRPLTEYGLLGLQQDSIIKLVADQDQSVDNEKCKNRGYDNQFLESSNGLDSSTASVNYKGKIQLKDPSDVTKLVFNSDLFSNMITVKKTGVLAVCYCGEVSDAACKDNNWKFVTRLTIKGPAQAQQWLFSTNVVFRIEYRGFGLSKNDKLRVIAPEGKCTDNNFNPDTASFPFTNLRVQCPSPCEKVGNVDEAINGDLETLTLADDRSECDKMNSNCKDDYYITQVTVQSSTKTMIKFNKNPALKGGVDPDVITIGANVVCSSDADANCTPEKLAVLRGRYEFADKDNNDNKAPDEFMTGHKVSLVEGCPECRTIPIGWTAAEKPKFSVNFPGGKGGKWEGHSRAITKEEIKGTKEYGSMRVCWKFGGKYGKYVAEVGKLTLKDPNMMEDCTISLSTVVQNAKAPVVLSFRTGRNLTGKKYDQMANSMQLKVVFHNINIMEVYTSDITPQSLVADESENEIHEAKQSVCGKLFRELWSADTTRGFPLPKGCYHKTFNTMREVFMLFEKKNGLKADTQFQIVMNAGALTLDQASYNGVVEVYPMDDVENKPYEAIERGVAKMTKFPQAPAEGADSSMFLDPGGFKVVGGVGGVLELKGTNPIKVELTGHPTVSAITANSVLRVFMWPLMEWMTGGSCTATCVSSTEISTKCGDIKSCKGEPVVPGFNNNVLKVILPSNMESLFGNVKHRINIAGITLPSGGFFSGRLGAQVSTALDVRPHYIHSTGEYLWKEADLGRTVAKLVSKHGDGNSAPFKGYSKNVIYLKMVFAVTLLSVANDGDAMFSITLPKGYRCRIPDPTDKNSEGDSPWQAETSLQVFGTGIPQGRGTPDDGTTTHGWSNAGGAVKGLHVHVDLSDPVKLELNFDGTPVSPGVIAYERLPRGSALGPYEIVVRAVVDNSDAHLDGVVKGMKVSAVSGTAHSDKLISALRREHVDEMIQLMNTAASTYTHESQICDFKLKKYGVIFSGSSLLARMVVDNPARPMQRAHPDNNWYVSMQSKGFYSVTLRTANNLFRAMEADYSSNLAVLGLLKNALVQPTDFTAGSSQEVNIFFESEQAVQAGGVVFVDAPVGFSFVGLDEEGTTCQAGPLDDKTYYATGLKSTYPLPGVVSCIYAKTPFNRAEIKLFNKLNGRTRFGFKIRVQNPAVYDWRQQGAPHCKDATGATVTTAFPSENKCKYDTAPTLSGRVWTAASQGWRIYTATNFRHYVDGIDRTAPVHELAASPNEAQQLLNQLSFGVYKMPFKTSEKRSMKVSVSDLRPSAMSTLIQRARIEFTNIQVPKDLTAALRVVAPLGFAWSFNDNEFGGLWEGAKVPIANMSLVIPGATKDFPGGIPKRESNVLSWSVASYFAKEVYGFAAFVQVPTESPRRSSNAFFIELGYDQYDGEKRIAAAALHAPTTQALLNAMVEYTTNVEGKENALLFQVQTVSPIPQGGGIVMQAPENFLFSASCTPEIETDPPEDLLFLPGGCKAGEEPRPEPTKQECESTGNTWELDVTCHFHVESMGLMYLPIVTLRAGPRGIPPGKYRFELIGTNPPNAILNPKLATQPCGFSQCWAFRSFREILSDGAEYTIRNHELDMELWVPGFAINKKMVESRLPLLTPAQRLGTQRNDRPEQPNNLLFAFKLNKALAPNKEAHQLLLRGPKGFEFAEDCLPGVETREDQVFGDGNKWPPEYAVWDQHSKITSCYGVGSYVNMTITVDLRGRRLLEEYDPLVVEADDDDSGGRQLAEELPGLKGESLYIFRIAVQSNPRLTPATNKWTIDLGVESSEPFDSFVLWTFTRTKTLPVTTARSVTFADAVRTQNPITFEFRPHSTVNKQPEDLMAMQTESRKGGRLRVTAPENFEFYHENTACSVVLEEQRYTDMQGREHLGSVWSDEDIMCRVDEADLRVQDIKFASHREFSAGRDYNLIVTAYNPSQFVEGKIYTWRLESFFHDGETPEQVTALDLSDIQGFAVNHVLNKWEVLNQDPTTGLMIQNGMTEINALRFTMTFRDHLKKGDLIVIEAAHGFSLDSGGNFGGNAGRQAPTCHSFTWGKDSKQLRDSVINCEGGKMKFAIDEKETFPKDTELVFTLDTKNPSKTPLLTVNYWRCTHFSGKDADVIQSSHVLRGWSIVPQLQNVDVVLLGPNFAAESESSIMITFNAVSDADELFLQAARPKGFSFVLSTLANKRDQVLLDRCPTIPSCRLDDHEIRVALKITERTPTVVIIDRVKMGKGGGTTEFFVTTRKLSEKMDEKLNFQDGFVLPGKITVTMQTLYNDFTANKEKYPVKSMWEVQMGTLGYADFNLFISRQASPGDKLVIEGNPYTISVRSFGIVDVATGVPIRAVVLDPVTVLCRDEDYSNTMIAELEDAMQDFTTYKITLMAVTPTDFEARTQEKQNWHFRIYPKGWPDPKMDPCLPGGGPNWDPNDSLPSNTNDGVTMGFNLVPDLEFRVEVDRSPPMAEVEVKVRLNPKGTAPTELQLVAPPQFNFTSNCLVNGGKDIISCMPKKTIADGRKTAVLTCRETGLREAPQDLRIVVRTPASTPSTTAWFLEGMNSWSQDQVGWGEDAIGFEVLQMEDTGVSYAGVPKLPGQIAFKFETQETVDAGGTLRIELPAGFEVDCSGPKLRPISLPGSLTCSSPPPDDSPGPDDVYPVTLTLNETLVPGDYAFAIEGTPPQRTPGQNFFSLILMDRFGKVQDAAMNIAGREIQEGLQMKATEMAWSNSDSMGLSVIMMGFDLQDELPESPRKLQLEQILITFPEGFVHAIESVRDFESLNAEFPIAKTDWLDYTQMDRMRITLDAEECCKQGAYRFNFPVIVPRQVPEYNVWTISFCEAGRGSCQTPMEEGVLVAFPVAGFNIGQHHPTMAKKRLSAAAPRACWFGLLVTVGTLLVSTFLREAE